MSEKRITLRIPDDLHEQLVQAAKQEERSLNSEIEFILKQYVSKPKSS